MRASTTKHDTHKKSYNTGMTKALVIICFFIIILMAVLVSLKLYVPILTQLPSPRPSEKTITLVFGGDVMLGRTVTTTSLDINHGPTYPFIKIADLFKAADISFVNLETPIVDPCPRRTGSTVFCAPSTMVTGLTFAGIDIVSLANNHTYNYGKKGFESTKEFLDQNNIKYTGAGRLTTIKISDTTFGFLGFDKAQQSSPVFTQEEEDLIQKSNKEVDILIVSMHWGVEYQAHPLEGQRNLAQRMVDLGADIVVGHHPHWVQDTETIGRVPIYYSLGNLVFDQMWSEETKKGLLVQLTIKNKQIVDEKFIPTYIKNRGQPEIFY